MLIILSWRNIWRNKIRSLVVILAIAIGLTGGTFMVGIMNGMVAQQINCMIDNEISHIQIHHPKFTDNLGLQYLIEDVDKKIEIISQQEAVTNYCYRIKTTAMASTATTGAGVTLIGVIPENEKTVTKIHNKLVEGTYFEKNTKTPSIVIGQKLGHKLKAKPGNKIVITTQTLSGEMSYMLFSVEGIFKTNDTRFDESNVFVSLPELGEALGMESSQANEIAVRTTSGDMAGLVSKNLQGKLPGQMVQSWLEIKPMLIVLINMMDQYAYWLMIIILIALIFGIINTMLMVILERQREIGMLMAIGMNKTRIFRMILTETTMLSLTGGFLGLAASFAMMSVFGNTGINFASWATGLEAMGYSAFVYPEVSTGFYIVITVLVIVTAMIASLWPARKALKLNPAEALRIE